MIDTRRAFGCVVFLMILSVCVFGCDDDDEPINGFDAIEDVVEDAPDDAADDVEPDAPADAPGDIDPDAPEDVAEDAVADAEQDAPADVEEDAVADADAGEPVVEEVDCAQVTPDASVSMAEQAFDPATVTISAGEVVRWNNDESDQVPHTVTSGRAGDQDAGVLFDSGTLNPNDSYCLQFNEVDTFEYFCEIHPVTMDNGLVDVQ